MDSEIISNEEVLNIKDDNLNLNEDDNEKKVISDHI